LVQLEGDCFNLGDGPFCDIENITTGECNETIGLCTEAPAAIPTLSEWGLIAMAGVLGIVGFMVLRRRKVTA
jgi:hypothetical protein